MKKYIIIFVLLIFCGSASFGQGWDQYMYTHVDTIGLYGGMVRWENGVKLFDTRACVKCPNGCKDANFQERYDINDAFDKKGNRKLFWQCLNCNSKYKWEQIIQNPKEYDPIKEHIKYEVK